LPDLTIWTEQPIATSVNVMEELHTVNGHFLTHCYMYIPSTAIII